MFEEANYVDDNEPYDGTTLPVANSEINDCGFEQTDGFIVGGETAKQVFFCLFVFVLSCFVSFSSPHIAFKNADWPSPKLITD